MPRRCRQRAEIQQPKLSQPMNAYPTRLPFISAVLALASANFTEGSEALTLNEAFEDDFAIGVALGSMTTFNDNERALILREFNVITTGHRRSNSWGFRAGTGCCGHLSFDPANDFFSRDQQNPGSSIVYGRERLCFLLKLHKRAGLRIG
jgi:hypothetical protein